MTTSVPEHLTVLDLVSALYNDVERIHRDPHALANPAAIPLLAELALSFDADGSPRNCQKAVSKLLHKALMRVRSFENCSGEELGNATAELLGIGTRDWTNQTDRFENAATELYAYSNGESLRKTSRKRSDGQKAKVWVIFYELLVEQLVALASDASFTPSGRFMSDTTSQLPLPSRVSAVAVRHQLVIVAGEASVLFRYGGARAVSENRIPCIIALAAALYPQGGTPLEKVEALFTWTAHQARYPRSLSLFEEKRLRKARAQAILELANFGKTRDLPKRRKEILVIELLVRPAVNYFQESEYWNEVVAAARAMAWTLWELMNEQGIEIVGHASPSWEELL
jgi:hypothetical protein